MVLMIGNSGSSKVGRFFFNHCASGKNPFLSFKATSISRRRSISQTTITNYNAHDENSNSNNAAAVTEANKLLLKELRQLDTASLCDADKSVLAAAAAASQQDSSSAINTSSYAGIRLFPSTIRPIHSMISSCSGNNAPFRGGGTMAGIARTVKCTKRNDFLAVLRGLAESRRDEVLVVDSLDSTRAVSGGLFALEAAASKRLAGIVVTNGPMRDASDISVAATTKNNSNNTFRCYATFLTPYSGTTQSPGEMQAVIHVGTRVSPGDVVVGDDDGILVGSTATFQTILPVAKEIQATERIIQQRLLLKQQQQSNNEGTEVTKKGNDEEEEEESSLVSMTNYREHLEARLAGKPSSLEFKLD